MDKPEQVRVTIVDIARDVGVSPKTVSRVIRGDDYVSPETLERVKEAILRMGYRPNRAARSLVSNRSGVIGIVVPGINNPFFSEVVRGIEDTAVERDVNVLLLNTGLHVERERAAYHFLEENGVDGVIVDLPLVPVPELERVIARQKAAVLIDHPYVRGATGVILIDFYNAAYKSILSLARWGRRYPGYLSLPGDYYTFNERRRGIIDAAAELRIPMPARRFGECDGTLESNFQAAKALLRQNPEMDSLICLNDVIAIGALEACDELKIPVPDQVAIIGFDDIETTRLNRIALTTHRIPKRDIGIQAAQMLLDALDGIPSPVEVLMEIEFIARKTTPY